MGPRVFVGTSGWSYPEWAGAFYPHGLARRRWLEHYARRFPAVELNASFYRLPSEAAVAAWNRALPEGFRLALKGPRRITHLARLRDIDELLDAFADRIAGLRAARAVLWQLPPSFRPTTEHRDRLGVFLERLGALPRPWLHAVEFRHPEWWDAEVAALLDAHGAAFVAVSHPRLPEHCFAADRAVYVRFHGLGARLYEHDYSDGELRAWVERLRPFLVGERVLYTFFNNTATVAAVRNARRFAELWREAGVEVAAPFDPE